MVPPCNTNSNDTKHPTGYEKDRRRSTQSKLAIELPSIEHCDFLRNQYILNGELTFEKIVLKQPFGTELFRLFCLSNEIRRCVHGFLEWLQRHKRKTALYTRKRLLSKLNVFKKFRKSPHVTYFKLDEVRQTIENSADNADCTSNVIDTIFQKIEAILSGQLFYRFVESRYFDRFLQWKWFEMQPISNDCFRFYQLLGKGTYGEVYGCKDKFTNKLYACKIFHKANIIKDNDYSLVMTEKIILSKLNSPFLINLIYAYETEYSLHLILTMMQGGDLKYHIYRDITNPGFSIERARFYAAEILLGLEFLHEKNIIHRDCKASNVLMDLRGHVRLSDFGLSTILLPNEYAKGFFGTNGYVAPEIIRDESYTFTCDWYSFGCLVYEMIEGKRPFTVASHHDNDTTSKLYEKVLSTDETYSNKFVQGSRKLCKGLLQKCPTKRIGFNGSIEVRQMDFFHEIDWNDVYNRRIQPSFIPDLKDVRSNSVDYSITRPLSLKKQPQSTEEDKQFYKLFSTGIESEPWQRSIIEGGRFYETNNFYGFGDDKDEP